MTTIHFLDKNTDTLVGFLTNEGEDMYWADWYERDLRTLEGAGGFTMPSTIAEASKIEHRSRFVAMVNGEYREYIVFEENTSIQNQKEVIGVETYMDLDKQFLLQPGVYTGTMLEHLQLVLPDTEFDIGVIQYQGIRTLEINDYIGAYSYILRLLTAFGAEVKFRIEVTGNRITGRYVDALQRVGEITEKEIEIGKDLIDVEMIIHSDRVVTALRCVGPEREDGTRLETFISDDDAFQRWNLNGKHLVGYYSPQSENDEMTLEQLEQYGRTELNKRIAAIVEYRVSAAKLREFHERVRLGDTIRIKNPRFVPPLYASARIVREEGSIADDSQGSYEIGEVVLYDIDSINANINALRQRYDAQIQRLNVVKNSVRVSSTKPDVTKSTQGDVWVNVAEGNKIYTFDTVSEDYQPKELEAQALNVTKVSDVTDDLGNIRAGEIIGVRIRSENPLNGWVELDFGQLFAADTDNNYAQLSGNRLWFGNGPGNPFTGDGITTTFFIQAEVGQSEVLVSKPFKSDSLETGWMGGSCISAAASTNGSLNGVNFRIKKTYTPSSISFESVNSNVTPNFYDINANGFTFGVPSEGANTLKWVRGRYTA